MTNFVGLDFLFKHSFHSIDLFPLDLIPGVDGGRIILTGAVQLLLDNLNPNL